MYSQVRSGTFDSKCIWMNGKQLIMEYNICVQHLYHDRYELKDDSNGKY